MICLAQATAPLPERVLILAPWGRDAAVAASLLGDGAIPATVCPDPPALVAELRDGAGAAVMTEEAVTTADLRDLAGWIADQPKWSDFPFVLLTRHGAGPERNPAALRWLETLRNVALVERPFHPVTLLSVVRTALGSRRRQYEARALIETQRETEENLRVALAAGRLGAWSLDTRSWLLDASDTYKAIYGRPPDRPFGFQDVQDSLAPGEIARVSSAIAHTLRTGEPYDIEFRIIWPDGSEHWLASRARLTDGGAPARLVGVSSDVTARRRKDDELNRYRERLEELVAARTRELELANQQLRAQALAREQSDARLRQAQKMEAVGQLTGGIAHDFNNLLSAIMGSLELINKRTEDPRILRLAANALTAVTRGARLTRQLLAFSRTQRLDLAPVALNALVEGMHDLLVRSLGPAVAVRFALDPAAGTCTADANQLELAILNLAINARDAMPDGGTVTIGSGLRGRMVALSVADSGHGMAPEVLERAFEPFFTTKPIGRGTGLGLSQVYGIARQSGGTVTIESKPGHGTTVIILLPSAAEAVSGAPDVGQPARRLPTGHARDTILVVDDDSEVRQSLVESLQTLGYGVAEAADGPAGLAALSNEPVPDLMIVDFAMAGMNGAEVAREARRRRPGLPIVLATGYAETTALVAELSDLPVLRKPFHMAELAATVHGALRRDRPSADS